MCRKTQAPKAVRVPHVGRPGRILPGPPGTPRGGGRTPMSIPTKRPALHWLLAFAFATALLGGCTTIETTRPAPGTAQASRDARIQQAADLLQARGALM